MASRRDFKKQIRYCCGDVAAECILAKYFIDNAKAENLDKAVLDVASLQQNLISRANVSFDKTPKAFPDKHAYRKARATFMRKAFKSLENSFIDELGKVVKEMNAACPK